MKTVVPAFRHLWCDLSPFGKLIFISTVTVFIIGAAALIYTSIEDAKTRAHYRTTIERICRNEPRLCENK